MKKEIKLVGLKIFLVALVVFMISFLVTKLKDSLITNEDLAVTGSLIQDLERNLDENAELFNSPSEDERIFVNQLLVEVNNLIPDNDSKISPEELEVTDSEPEKLTGPELIDFEYSDLTNPFKESCPAYVNCMPTFDASPNSCTIPPGCEGVTQKVY